MNVITLKDYAKQNNVTYEAVRQQVNRYAKELGDHVIRDGRQQFLDEEAVAFLDSKRQKNPVVVVQQDKDEQIEALERENKNLLIKIAELSDWKAEKAVAIAEANHQQFLLEESKQQIEALEAQNADLSAEKDFYMQKAAENLKEAENANLRLTEAHEGFEQELKKRDEQIQELENRKWYQLLFKKNKG